MTAALPLDFESLLISQNQTLTTSHPKDFNHTFLLLAKQALEWFKVDRLTLFPNSMILLNEGKTVSASRGDTPAVEMKRFVVGNYKDYMKLLRSLKTWQTYDEQALRTSHIAPLQALHKEGAHWHGIIRLELFGQVWGAMAFSRFSSVEPELTEKEIRRIKLLCDMWLVYWQHSTMTRSLRDDDTTHSDESEKLLLLSKKQSSVLALLAQGYTAKQCAEELFLSPRTIESHKYRMIDLLNLDNHTELVQFALRNGLGIKGR
ncbi:LuxR C-terminal-related transcriptional regulator [Vibrio tapetis subsp. quintayensis]|uniref:helix-turn-helix transcriptional regulator n=1 Tax=Vibrio tapetis TaxID=52443 RepID=UPI0025B36C5C|nr:LuxR C-terminal-related transcriptional regulator [Vibrio tapetis]MDN3683041.1 LuxR C-terminal-related transcriptional regulator [Vibrio tapetis subsp. quintayensis]